LPNRHGRIKVRYRHHRGGSDSGKFDLTFTITNVASGWPRLYVSLLVIFTVNKLRIYSSKKGVGVAENPRSGVGARGSSVKKGRMYGKICYILPSIVLPLLNLLTVVILVVPAGGYLDF
jgi:hypothetical protein